MTGLCFEERIPHPGTPQKHGLPTLPLREGLRMAAGEDPHPRS